MVCYTCQIKFYNKINSGNGGYKQMQKYECKVCGAELHWDPNAGCLKCKFCDSEFQPSDFEDKTLESGAEKKSKAVDKRYTNSGQNIADSMLVYKCDECGAEVVASDTTMATICPYCGRAISVTDKSAGNFRPERLIPFAVDKKKAIELFTKYTKSSILVPKAFQDEHTIEKTQGLFVPFFLHSVDLRSKAEIHGEHSHSHRSGDDKITETKIYEIDMRADGKFTDIPTDASTELDNGLMDALEPFSYDKVQPFNPAYMAGYLAEQPDEKANETKQRAIHRAEEAMEHKMVEEAGNYSNKRVTSSNHSKSNYSNSYAMLPVWLMNVDYAGTKHTFAINGETGKAVGKLPISIPKTLGAFTIPFFSSQLILGILMLFLG